MIRLWKMTLSILVLLGLMAYNVIAYNQAYAMLHFSESGERTPSPEDLTLLQKLQVLVTGINLPKPENRSDPGDVGLPYNTVDLTVEDDLQIEAWYVRQDQPTSTVILFHGYGASKESLLGPATAFYEMGHTLLLVDFRGSGGSDGVQTTVGYAEMAEVTAAFNYVRTQFPEDHKIILYGQSMGGAAILRAVSKGLGPDHIIIEAVFDEMVITVGNRFRSMGLPAFPSAQLLTYWGGVQTDMPGFRHNPVDYAEYVYVPTLMLYGEDDPRVTVDQAQKLFNRIKSERKEAVLFSDAAHESFYDADPTLWEASVVQFLKRD